MFVKHKKDMHVMKSKIYRYFINAGLKRSNFNGKDVNCENEESWKKKNFIAKQRTLTINFELENHVKLQQFFFFF